jgi:uncharacterized protein
MSTVKRKIIQSLLNWKKNPVRKPLILRGARQVGKTTAVHTFSENFDHFVYLNLEREQDAAFFLETDNVKILVDRILFSKGIDRKPKDEILLFIDEIQEIPKVIALLRYFYEDLPDIFVIAAGSLLEFALGKVHKMPVGRIQYLFMHPLNFKEYLEAQNQTVWMDSFEQIPVPEYAHETLLNQFNTFALLGGMPEVIQRYLQQRSFADVNVIYKNIWRTYKEDVEKYASNESEKRIIRHILDTSPFYLDERIKFQNFGNSNYRSREVSEAFRNIDASGLIRLIYPTTSLTPPIQLDFKKSPRLQFLDIGIVNNVRNIQVDLMTIQDLSDAYKGALIPQLIYQELTSLQENDNEKQTFWVRDKTQSSAEVDLIFHYKDKLIPIEIKSGSTGSLKSLHQFINSTNHALAVRIFGGKFSIQKQKTPEGKDYTLMNLPYYLGTKIPEYIAYFHDIVEKTNLIE